MENKGYTYVGPTWTKIKSVQILVRIPKTKHTQQLQSPFQSAQLC
jgi:hypothetical protein